MKIGVIIVAGGSGARMGGEVPKQFLAVGGKEVLVHTLEKFVVALNMKNGGAEIILVLPAEHIPLWNKIVAKYSLASTHRICEGGVDRLESVANGLAALGDCDIIAIHDGVRPLLSERLIMRCIELATKEGTAIPVVGSVDSFRFETDGYLQMIDRSRLRAIQTPQVFRADIIRNAYARLSNTTSKSNMVTETSKIFTDDSSVVEYSGVHLSFCEGERLNIKITHPEDLLFAEAVINTKNC